MTRLVAACLLALLLSPCAARAQERPRDSARAAAGQPFSRRVVVLVEASPAEIDSVKARMPLEDFYVVADDMNWYRASAAEYVQKRGLPLVRLSGRRPLDFVVNGTVRRLDLAGVKMLDLLILYDPAHEPRVIATDELEAVDEYFHP